MDIGVTITQLDTAFSSLMSQLLVICANYKPSYSVEGQSVTFGNFLKDILQGLKDILEFRAMLDPAETRTVMIG